MPTVCLQSAISFLALVSVDNTIVSSFSIILGLCARGIVARLAFRGDHYHDAVLLAFFCKKVSRIFASIKL
jgi:hypothetical protein